MPTHRRARRKSIAGNITDVQKRLRFLETRPAPSKLASKAVATKNIALRAIETELIADSSITTRTVGQAQITNFTLSSVTDPDGAAVDTENIADGAVENAQLAGNITDDKIAGMSSSKLIGTITNAQLAGNITQDKIVSLPTTKLTGTITNAQLAGSITEDKITSLPTTKLTGTITNDQLAGSIADGKIVGISASKLIGTVTNGQLAGSITSDKILSLAASKVSGTLDISTIPAAVLTDVNATSPVTVSGTGRSRTIGINTASFALASHTHSQYAANGRYDTSFAGDHLGHGGHSHFINTASTKKLKKEISDYSIDLEKLFLLKPKQFKYRNQARNFSKNREWDYGYIAEEALEIGVEEIVGYDEKGEVDSINYGLLSVFVLELVKKQQSEIDLLSEEIKRLKEKE